MCLGTADSRAHPGLPQAVLPTNDDGDLLRLRHSSAHVMAMAVQRLFSNAQVTVGPWIEGGFYYDFYKAGEQSGPGAPLRDRRLRGAEQGPAPLHGAPRRFTPVDLKAIKKEMDSIIKKNYPIVREEVSRAEARRRIEAIGERFKLEILDGIKDDTITIYSIGDEWCGARRGAPLAERAFRGFFLGGTCARGRTSSRRAS